MYGVSCGISSGSTPRLGDSATSRRTPTSHPSGISRSWGGYQAVGEEVAQVGGQAGEGLAGTPASVDLGAHRVEVHEPRLEQGSGYLFHSLVHPTVQLDLVVQRPQDVGDGSLLGEGREGGARLLDANRCDLRPEQQPCPNRRRNLSCPKVANEEGIIAFEILDVKGGVQRPEIVSDEINVPDCAVPTCHYARAFNLGFDVIIGYARRRYYRDRSRAALLLGEVVPAFERDYLPQCGFGPLPSCHRN